MAEFDQLIHLIEEARAKATGAGPEAQTVVRSLDEALAAARALGTGGTDPDEGTRLGALHSANDG